MGYDEWSRAIDGLAELGAINYTIQNNFVLNSDGSMKIVPTKPTWLERNDEGSGGANE